MIATILLAIIHFAAGPYPIQFGIPEVKLVSEIPKKDKDCAIVIPGDGGTYIYEEEADYYADYQRSYFALTQRKSGWDCMRHYEILANGCIPYFLNLDNCPSDTMVFLPKKLILEAMHLPGVIPPSNGHPRVRIDHGQFNRQRYYEILQKLLEHTRNHLTTRSIAQYILKTIGYRGTGTVLYLSSQVWSDYMRECVLIGLREELGERLIDCPKIDYLYTSYPQNIKKCLGDGFFYTPTYPEKTKDLYGKGFSYTKVLDEISIDREGIEERIRNHEFDLIIYGSTHRGLPFHSLVKQIYDSSEIVYICGEDSHRCSYGSWNQLFLREWR